MAHASSEMPYFIKPSVNLDAAEKEAAYQEAIAAIDANLQGESNMILKMATINCLLKTALPYYYWVGFYIVENGQLVVGPYQGTLGCLYIAFGKGVCGKVAETQKTQIEEDVHALTEGINHIACDPNSRSEIVVPVFNPAGDLLAVFDVDSTAKASFDAVDQHYLELIMNKHFKQA